MMPVGASNNDDVLEHEVLLCRGEHVMLTCNLWVEYGLVNRVLGYVEDIHYMPGSKFPEIPVFATIIF